MNKAVCRIFLLFLTIFLYINLYAATDNVNTSPYDVIYNYFHFLKKGSSYDELQASRSFDIPNKRTRIEATLKLKEILDSKVDPSKILEKTPDNPSYIDTITKKNIYVLYDKLPQIYLEQKNGKWYFSPTTVDAIPDLHKKIFPFGTNIWAKWFPLMQHQEFLKLYPWQWAGIGIIFGSFLICFFLLKYVFRFLFNRFLFKRYANEIQDINKLKTIANIFSIWIGFKIFQLFIPTLFINPKYSMPILVAVNFVSASLIVFVVYRLVELIIFYTKQYFNKGETQWDEQIAIVLQKFLKFIVVFLGLFYVLNTLNVNITTIIAGLSVGGLAVALAAQDTVKNFIASVMIFADKPFRIGDTIKTNDFEGSVLEVGFRSTRIKTPDNSIVYISNAKLSEMTIDNKGYRIFVRFKTEILLPYNTPLQKVDAYIDGIRKILKEYPFTLNSTIDVYLTNIQLNGLTIMIHYTNKLYNKREELQHREYILKKILLLAELLQVKLSDNTQIYLEKEDTANNGLVENNNEKIDKFFSDYKSEISKMKE